MTADTIRWGRVVYGGFLAELLLVVSVIPLQAFGAGDQAITVLAVAGSFVALLLVAWWLGRSLPRPIVHGALMGAAAAAIYTLLYVVGQQFAADTPPMPFIYYVAHALKLTGGAAGGALAQRSVRPTHQPAAGAGR